MWMACLVFFFFQAEDGIRDYKVTGVQTCALPISVACASERGFIGASGSRENHQPELQGTGDRKSTRLNSSHLVISYAVFCLKKKIMEYEMAVLAIEYIWCSVGLSRRDSRGGSSRT